MIDLYALTSPNVQKIYIMLEETKLPYKEHFVDVWKGEQYNPDLLKINPNAKIPVASFPWTRNHDIQGVKWEDNPNLARWFNAINERPPVKAALAKVGAIKSNRDTASEDQKDRFFNRGRYARA